MKKYLSAAAIAICVLLIQNATIAQDKEEEEKAKDKMGEYDEIVIKRKDAGKDGKVTIEIKDGEVKVNGKPIDEYEDDNLSVRRKKALTYGLTRTSPFRSENFNFGNGHNLIIGEDRPFLGVTTDEASGGARITSVTSNSAAEKAGLKKGDIITRINDEAVEDHGDVTKAIGKLKADDKVTITYKRDGKETKTTATLGKRNSSAIYGPNGDFDFNFDHNEQFDRVFSFGGRPRLGIKAQDTEDGKGVKVIDVDEGSAADKAGIKENDVITEFEGKAVNSADALAEASRESKDKSSLKIKLNRGGSSQTVEVKIPKKLKTANL
jgi:serine protease Do